MNKIILTTLLVAGLVAGCAQQRFNFSDDMMMDAPDRDDVSVFYFQGVFQQQNINAVEVCGSADKISAVEVQETVMNYVLAAVTLSIYTPKQYRVYCKN